MLGVFALVLAGAVYYSRSHTAAPAADATPTAAPLWTFTGQDILTLKVEDLESGTYIEAHRQAPSGWALDHPQGSADIGRLEMAAETLASLVPSDSVAGADLASFGLDTPSDRITLSLQNGTQDQLLVGQTSPTGDVVYVQLPAENTVYFVSSYTLANVTGMTSDPPIATPTPEPSATLPPVLSLPTPTP
jgi:hypothetical protein